MTERRTDTSDHPIRTLAIATSSVAMMVLIQSCILDFYVVRMIPYPEHVHDYEWAVLMIPFLPALALLAWSRRPRSPLTLGVIVGAVVIGTLLSIPLILTLGVWFHFSIGGRL